MRRGAWLILALLAPVILSASPVEWEREQSGHFTFMFLPQSNSFVQNIIPVFEQELARVSGLLQAPIPSNITVVAAPDRQTFASVQGGRVPSWVSGTAEPASNRIFLRPLSGVEVRHSTQRAVIAHELTHLLLHEKLGTVEPPRWLDEGLAVFMANEPFLSRSESLFSIGFTGNYIPFRLLEKSFPDSAAASAAAYAESGDFVRFLYNQYGAGAFNQYLALMAGGDDPDAAMFAAYHKTLFDLEGEWAKELRWTYGLIPALSGGGFLWFLLSLLAMIAYMRRYFQSKRQLAEMEAHEAGLTGRYWEGDPDKAAGADLADDDYEDDDFDEDDFEEDDFEDNGSERRH